MTNKAKSTSTEDGKEFLRNSFKDVQHVLSAHLDLSARSISHDGVMGEVNEQHWIQLLRQYLPNRYACDSGIVIDSQGHTSQQIDIVIYDPQYTPTLLTQQAHRYIPAEAVYAILEVKPTINRQLLFYAGEKAESVRKLYRTSVKVTHIDGESPPKKLFAIVSGIVAGDVEWSDGFAGDPFKKVMTELVDDKSIDCGCGLRVGSFDRFSSNGDITLVGKDSALILFLFRLLGKLQSLGTVPAIDWSAYASIF